MPIEEDKYWGYANRYQLDKESDVAYNGVMDLNADLLKLHMRREPRFYANIACD